MPTPSKLVYRVCSQCFKTFCISLSRVKSGGGIFCSGACHFANQTARTLPPEIRFWKYVNKTEDCWLWTGAQRGKYGAINLGRSRTCYTHRFSWEMFSGPVPIDLWVLHKCDVPLCVRPDHLFLGTALDNNRDRLKKHHGRFCLITAFGETKHRYEWLEDPRCLVKRKTFNGRLDKGIPPEEAMTSPPTVHRGKSGRYVSKVDAKR